MKLDKLVAVAGILSLVLAFYSYVVPPKQETHNSKLFGIWLQKYSYPVSKGRISINGTTEYFNNGVYNFVGQIEIFVNGPTGSPSVLYDVDGSGEWVGGFDNLTTKVVDMKSYFVSLKVDSKRIDLTKFPSKFKDYFPKIEDHIPVGMSESYTIVSLNNKESILEVDDPKGRPITIKGKKQSNQYQR